MNRFSNLKNSFTSKRERAAKGPSLTGMPLTVIGYVNERGKHADVRQKDLEMEFSIRGKEADQLLEQMERDGLITLRPATLSRMRKIELTEKAIDAYQFALSQIWSLDSSEEETPSLDLSHLFAWGEESPDATT